jgi:aldose 1-epimerase
MGRAVIAPSGEQIEIAAGGQQAVVVTVGGSLRSYVVEGRQLVDGYGADQMCSSSRGQVLIP